MRLYVLLLRQDDPKKCTAQKLAKFGLAKEIKKISKNTIVLNPFAEKTLLPHDRKTAGSITAIDCSWSIADQTFVKNYPGIHRKLPPVFAGNPINYAKLGKLTTAEALATACFILGFEGPAQQILGKFKWGDTFLQLNSELLSDYAKLDSEEQIAVLLEQYNIAQPN